MINDERLVARIAYVGYRLGKEGQGTLTQFENFIAATYEFKALFKVTAFIDTTFVVRWDGILGKATLPSSFF